MITVGSDFSGVGAFNQALDRLKINYKTIFACDNDKYARQTYVLNYGTKKDNELVNTPAFGLFDKDYSFYFPNNVYNRTIPKEPLDIYMTSPPCQSFSLAGKRKGENDKRGVLFYNSHQFIKQNKPRYFIFENVKGLLSDDNGKTFCRWLDYLGGKTINGNPVIFPHQESVPYHIYYKVLNAKNYGVPQNRERIFIIGIRNDADNTFNWPKAFPLVKRLKDVLEKDVDEKFYLSENNIKALLIYNNRQLENGNGFSAKFRCTDTTQTMDALKVGGGGKDDLIKVKSATKKGYEVATENDSINLSNLSSETSRGRVGKQVAQTLDTSCAQAVIQLNTSKESNGVQPYKQNRVYSENGLSPTLDTECGRPSILQKVDNVIVTKNYIQYDVSGKGYKSQQDRVYPENGVMCTIPVGRTETKTKVLLNNYKIRRLTPRECFRLMDFPETFKWNVSNSQAYKQAGNSIVVAVLAGIISKLNL